MDIFQSTYVTVEHRMFADLTPGERFYVQSDYRTPGTCYTFRVERVRLTVSVPPLPMSGIDPHNDVWRWEVRAAKVRANGTFQKPVYLKPMHLATLSQGTVDDFIKRNFNPPAHRMTVLLDEDGQPWKSEK